ncbi:hypothetical protein [Streptomyces yokosukanensis]|uniref:hypothetical protein n=1 Tax=Streptomyces yokosukanensis TaxID=67386 RepID=UPI000A9DFEFD|nr:hypothetical protein [Streptomyces yokosukanensis]
MSVPSRPLLKSITTTPTGPHAARPAEPTATVGEPKDVARQGVRTALRPDSQTPDPADPTPERPGIRIYAPPVYRDHEDGARWSKRYGDTPRAAYACSCGQANIATGPRTIPALVTEYEVHKLVCDGSPASHTEGRVAA